MSKLDHFLISEGLMELCSNISASTLDRYLSDHQPILLRDIFFDYDPIPFRFYHYWFEIEGFDKFVEEVWSAPFPSETNVMVSVLDKGDMNSDVLNTRMNVMKSLQDLVKLDSLEMAEKAKIKWSIEGDKNSKYFHGILNKKRNQLEICGILVEGAWIDSPDMVKNEFLSQFKDQFNHPGSSRFHLHMNFPNILTLKQQVDMERNVTKDAIKKPMWDCGLDKYLGPDCFTFGFYRSGGNSTFITLITKMQDAKMVKDFRPISLIGSLYKIITTILANRLVTVLGDILNEVQSAFIENRKIMDGPFILDELIQWCKSKKKQTMIFKKNFNSIKVLNKETFFLYFYLFLIMESFHLSFHNVVNEGIKVGGMISKIKSWDEIVNKLLARISKWKMKTLSIGRRLTLLKSVLGSSPIYYMSMFKVPMQVLKRMESIRSHFFNGVEDNEKKMSWVRLKIMLASKEKGGLGVSSFYALNRALLFKWVWRFRNDNTSLWAKIIQAMHGEDGSLSNSPKSSLASIWLDII
nr:RNA-directed DNA polymerase, eukaryota [Tanacetum cinerariifolium]